MTLNLAILWSLLRLQHNEKIGTNSASFLKGGKYKIFSSSKKFTLAHFPESGKNAFISSGFIGCTDSNRCWDTNL